ncbi:CPBP family intramembrane glutamic endopeptidase [Rhodanobacter thiooxydans]|nr:CPBP family intramembrane glutamic endopeptidase [Rhodanobacter thiooxydans]MCW0202430.1 CPBP family intramembrane metalloprotease [Rhodanobacter thiooxydans]
MIHSALRVKREIFLWTALAAVRTIATRHSLERQVMDHSRRVDCPDRTRAVGMRGRSTSDPDAMNGSRIPCSRGLWIFTGYLVIRLMVEAAGTIGPERILQLPDEQARLIGAYAGLLGEGLAAGGVWLLVRYYYGLWSNVGGIVAMGLFVPVSKQVMLSVLGGVASAAVVLALNTSSPSGSSPRSPAIDMYTTHGKALLYFWLIAGITVAPFVEELLFRGVAFSVVASHFNAFAGAVASVLLFMLVHVPQLTHHWTSAVAITTLATTCAIIRVNKGSLWAAMILHGSYNASLAVSTLV